MHGQLAGPLPPSICDPPVHCGGGGVRVRGAVPGVCTYLTQKRVRTLTGAAARPPCLATSLATAAAAGAPMTMDRCVAGGGGGGDGGGALRGGAGRTRSPTRPAPPATAAGVVECRHLPLHATQFVAPEQRSSTRLARPRPGRRLCAPLTCPSCLHPAPPVPLPPTHARRLPALRSWASASPARGLYSISETTPAR